MAIPMAGVVTVSFTAADADKSRVPLPQASVEVCDWVYRAWRDYVRYPGSATRSPELKYAEVSPGPPPVFELDYLYWPTVGATRSASYYAVIDEGTRRHLVRTGLMPPLGGATRNLRFDTRASLGDSEADHVSDWTMRMYPPIPVSGFDAQQMWLVCFASADAGVPQIEEPGLAWAFRSLWIPGQLRARYAFTDGTTTRADFVAAHGANRLFINPTRGCVDLNNAAQIDEFAGMHGLRYVRGHTSVDLDVNLFVQPGGYLSRRFPLALRRLQPRLLQGNITAAGDLRPYATSVIVGYYSVDAPNSPTNFTSYTTSEIIAGSVAMDPQPDNALASVAITSPLVASPTTAPDAAAKWAQFFARNWLLWHMPPGRVVLAGAGKPDAILSPSTVAGEYTIPADSLVGYWTDYHVRPYDTNQTFIAESTFTPPVDVRRGLAGVPGPVPAVGHINNTVNAVDRGVVNFVVAYRIPHAGRYTIQGVVKHGNNPSSPSFASRVFKLGLYDDDYAPVTPPAAVIPDAVEENSAFFNLQLTAPEATILAITAEYTLNITDPYAPVIYRTVSTTGLLVVQEIQPGWQLEAGPAVPPFPAPPPLMAGVAVVDMTPGA